MVQNSTGNLWPEISYPYSARFWFLRTYTQIKGLCSTKSSRAMLQKTKIVFFFVFNLSRSIWQRLRGILLSYKSKVPKWKTTCKLRFYHSKNGKFCSISRELFVKHKPWNCCWVCFYTQTNALDHKGKFYFGIGCNM